MEHEIKEPQIAESQTSAEFLRSAVATLGLVFDDCKSPSLEIMLDAVLENQNVNTCILSEIRSGVLPIVNDGLIS